MKRIRGLALCLALVLFCGGLTGCTDLLEDTTSKINNAQEDRVADLTTTEDETTTTQRITTTTTKRTTTTTTKRPTTTTTIKKPTTTKAPTETMVWIPTNGGTKYHRKSTCSKMIDPEYVTLSEAKALGFTPCGRCY